MEPSNSPFAIRHLQIDLNCDMGESFGAYSMGNDAALMPLITSANIACGFHAGDPRVMVQTVRLALQNKVALGAHPGFNDLVGFGRRNLDATPDEIESDVLYQIGALDAFARVENARLVHVKPHGALYNVAATNPRVARAIARAVARFDAHLVLVGLATSITMADAAREFGLRFAREGFCDRAYNRDGALRSRREPGALIHDPQRAATQALQMVRDQTVTTPEGETVPLVVDTLCVHGDTPEAVAILRAVREVLSKNDIEILTIRTR
ncbi:MAG: 5-oxoprolinase subunit PxpA [Chloroflexi bacterium]|nr:5-oxoprolinase subunit PxpA [Chloroflexota bacterium]